MYLSRNLVSLSKLFILNRLILDSGHHLDSGQFMYLSKNLVSLSKLDKI